MQPRPVRVNQPAVSPLRSSNANAASRAITAVANSRISLSVAALSTFFSWKLGFLNAAHVGGVVDGIHQFARVRVGDIADHQRHALGGIAGRDNSASSISAVAVRSTRRARVTID